MRARPTAAAAPPERRLAAILAAAIDDYPRHMRDDDNETHRRIEQTFDRLRAAILRASGTIFSFAADRLMAEFASATEALKCALLVQASAQGTTGTSEPIHLRIALNAGEILVSNRHIGGTAINLVTRLERIAPPGGVVLPAALHDQLRHAVAVSATPMGQPELRDVPEPVVVVAVSSEACLAWAGDIGAPRRRSPPRQAPEPRASLAIVPFQATGRHEALAGAATEDIIRGLGGMATWFAVIRTPPSSVHAPIDLQRIRQTSGARYILHGRTEAERDRLRLTVELNEAETGRVLLSDRFDHLLEQPAALRQDAASHVARAIPPLLLQREFDRSTLASPDTLTAHDLALRAFALIMHPERDTFAAAAQMLRHAEQRSPPHDSTWFVLVWWHLMAISQGWSTDPAADARAAAAAAARMNHTDPAASSLLAFMHSVLHRDHRVASAMLDRVIDTAPFCALAGSLKALTLGWIGDAQSAVFHAEQADIMPALGPERAWRDHVRALAHYLAGQYSEAATWAKVSAIHHPGLAANARLLAAALAVLGHLDEAHQAAQQVLEIDPDFHIATWWQRSMLPEQSRDILAGRLRLAGLPS